ncbi:MAG: TetR/AcrR family transcriptional regulator [Sedimentisphaerales bacterium]|nr:TetR/AcrR family transcriptional regulator [Sedimentisphaerales bacterium]
MAEQTMLSRRQRERQRHKKEILDAAMKLFAEKGFHSVSMNEIAAEAEFATGTLYNFFDSKEELYQEIMSACGQSATSVLAPIFESHKNEREKIACFIRASVRVFRENAAAIRLFLQANQARTLGLSGAHLSESNAKFREDMLARLRETFAAGVRKRLFRKLDPHVAALSLMAALEATVFSAATDASEASFEKRVGGIEQLFFKGILHAQDRDDD